MALWNCDGQALGASRRASCGTDKQVERTGAALRHVAGTLAGGRHGSWRSESAAGSSWTLGCFYHLCAVCVHALSVVDAPRIPGNPSRNRCFQNVC